MFPERVPVAGRHRDDRGGDGPADRAGASIGRRRDRPRPELARRRLLRRRPRRRAPPGPGRSPASWPRSPTAPSEVFAERFGRERRSTRSTPFTLGQRFDVEGYLDYHGAKLVRRFDANSYLRHQQGDGPARPRPRPGRASHGALRPRHGADPGGRASTPTRLYPPVPAGAAPRRARGPQGTPCQLRRDRQPRRPRRLPARHATRSRASHRRLPRRCGEVRCLTSPERRSAPTDPAADDRHRALHPETTRHPGRAGRQRHGAGADPVGDHDVRDADRRRGPPHGDRASGPTRFYSRYGNPTVQRLRGGHRRARGRRGGPGLRLGHGRGQRRGARAVLDGRPHRRPAPDLRRAPSCCCSRRAPASASTSRSSTAPTPEPGPRPCVPARPCCVLAETPANPRLDLVDLDELGGHRRARSRWSTRPSPRRSCSARSTTASTSSCTRPPRPSPATTTPPSAWSPAAPSSSTGCGASRSSRAPTRRPSTRMNGLRGPAHPRRAPAPADRDGPAPRRGARGPPGGRARCATRASTRTRSTTWPSARCRSPVACSPSTWPAGSRPAVASSSRPGSPSSPRRSAVRRRW